MILWPSFVRQWVPNRNKQAGWIQPSFSAVMWPVAGWLRWSDPYHTSNRTRHVLAPPPSSQKPPRQRVVLLQKHNFLHHCTSMPGSATLQYVCFLKCKRARAKDTGARVINDKRKITRRSFAILPNYLFYFSSFQPKINISSKHENSRLAQETTEQAFRKSHRMNERLVGGKRPTDI